jgi:NAD(P)-dependent dehydrogenase (short-subunit alcohol dehydrogenase family)
VEAGDAVISLSRSAPAAGQWHRCDLADPAQIEAVAAEITGKIDALIFVAGVWEAEAFSPGYSFAGSSADEMSRILAVNLQAPMLLARALLGNLRGGRIVLVGSTSGLDHIGTPEVAYNASKAGLRGAAQAMAVALQADGIAVAIVNPGDIASAEVLAAKREGTMRADGSLPMADVLGAIDCLLGLSAATAFCEIDLLAQRG